MKKSILMAIVALALLAAPAFAGEFGHQIVLDAGFGMSLEGEDAVYAALTDGATRFGVSGTLDDNNSIYIMWDMGGMDISGNVGNPIGALGQFQSTTNVLGAFGVEAPVTLSLTQGYGRLELHNRFNQWTGWEWVTRKDMGSPKIYDREYFIQLDSSIMNLVNVRLGLNPDFATGTDDTVNFLMDVWANFAVGPVNLGVQAFFINHCGNELPSWFGYFGTNLKTFGGEISANLTLGPVALMIALNDVAISPEDGDLVNDFMIAVKPVMAVGPATIGLGAFFGMTTDTALDEDATNMYTAIDLSVGIAMITIYGGVRINDLNVADGEEMADYMIYEMGATVGMGATSMSIGINGGNGSTGGATGDMRAVDNTVGLDSGTGTDQPMNLYVKFSTQMW